ncbi:MAG: alpha/beta hydrolase [Pseudomonadales bacterium]|nr:alpha/beta hydrolase [Pseudomonadales bacterium]
MSMPGPTSHNYYSQRLRLHYVDWGNPDAPLLLMIHGGRDHCRNWDWVAQSLRSEYHIIAPDLRGHGDSDWMIGGNYNLMDYVYDIAQLLDQNSNGPVKIMAHSLGGAISLAYAGIYPELVSKLVVIEGLGPPPATMDEPADISTQARITEWIEGIRNLSARQPRRYKNLEEALNRMQSENLHLSAERARHLTVHGTLRNEDGTYSWKFDNYVRSFFPVRIPEETQFELYNKITCPTLLMCGTESWATDPSNNGIKAQFQNAQVENIEKAGHWVHHDQLESFLQISTDFLKD